MKIGDFALVHSKIHLRYSASLIAATCAMLVHNLNLIESKAESECLSNSESSADSGQDPLTPWYELIEDVTEIQKP